MLAAMAALALAAGCSDDTPPSGSGDSPAGAGQRAGPTTRPAGPTTRPAAGAADKNPVVVIETSMGTIRAELWINKAPITVANFLRYVDETFYDNLIFHRVIKGFMIQGGGFNVMMRLKATHEQIRNEATADKKNLRGTLAMARTGAVHSATSQFFINHADNGFLDHKDNTARGFGYCAFGKVIEGTDVVDKIAAVPVADVGGHEKVPITPVVIKSIRRAK